MERYLLTDVEDVVELKPLNRFRFVFLGGEVSGHLNEKEIFAATDIDFVFPTPTTKTYLGVGGRWGQKGSSVRFTSLRVKRMTREGGEEN